MATQGPLEATTGENDASSGSAAWTNPGNIGTKGSPYASIYCGFSAESQWLKGTNCGFSVSGTIQGITCDIKRRNTNGQLADVEVRLVFAGSIDTLGGNRSTGANWPGTFTTATFGGSADLWDNMEITAAQVNNSGFGFAVRCVDTLSFESEGEVDFMEITVTYTPAGGGPVTQSRLVGFSQLVGGGLVQ